MNSNKKGKPVSDLEDINNHGLTDIIPPQEEYYTLDLKRGSEIDVDDLPEFDVGGNNPLDKNEEVVFFNNDVSTSSNAGGTIRQKDIIVNNTGIPGKPGHPGIDEGTG